MVHFDTFVNLTSNVNQELAFRLQTDVENSNLEFFTDQNGFQVIIIFFIFCFIIFSWTSTLYLEFGCCFHLKPSINDDCLVKFIISIEGELKPK